MDLTGFSTSDERSVTFKAGTSINTIVTQCTDLFGASEDVFLEGDHTLSVGIDQITPTYQQVVMTEDPSSLNITIVDNDGTYIYI